MHPIVQKLLDESGFVQSGALAARAGVARQTAFSFLQLQVKEGALGRLGAGRSARYVRQVRAPEVERFRFPLEGPGEDAAWAEVRAASKLLRRVGADAGPTWDYAFTEMVNNARDHSRGTFVEVALTAGTDRLVMTVEDDGRGALPNIQEGFHLRDAREAAELLVKGKARQGIFFTSRAMDRFVLESDALALEVDTLLGDWTLRSVPPLRGTRVRMELAWDSPRQLKSVFDAHSDEHLAFVRTSVHVRLFETASTFISRSEAKRLCAGLERFSEAVLDFKGVTAVGQGFCDEVFRVWARAHPGTKLIHVNAVADVEWFIRKAHADAKQLP
ncbi:MAG: hypothetical protein RL653_147 [Pseudomonadota bacterium]